MPFHLDLIFPGQLFNTPGTEIAPGSDIIGKYLKHQIFGHLLSPLRVLTMGSTSAFLTT
jgi:hypothetical protein